MPRKRDTTVQESSEELRKLEKSHKGKPEAARITMLRFLTEEPERGLDDIAVLVGVSVPTVKRWWKSYREGGIDALLKPVGRKSSENVDPAFEHIRKKIVMGELRTMAELSAYIGTLQLPNTDTVSTRQSAQSALHAETLPANTYVPSENGVSKDGAVTADDLFKFLALLPVTHQLQEWMDGIRKAIQTLLPDIDRMTISLDLHCDLLNPDAYHPKLLVLQSMSTGAKEVTHLTRSTNTDHEPQLEQLIDNLRRRKFPFKDYQPHHSYVYYYKGTAYLGAILLWREKRKKAISDRTLQSMKRLHGFMTLLFSDFVARHQAARPVEHAFSVALTELTTSKGLTTQEQRIIILQLLGFSYEEVAETLNISLNTVRYHLRSIYTKTDAHGQSDLFAKYFTPRIDPQPVPE